MSERTQDLHLLPANGICIQRRRGLHRDERENLEHVILNHVPERAGTVVVAAAAVLHGQRLCDRDLHRLDVVSIPKRLEDRVVESKAEQVLNRLFSEIVIDPVNLILVQRSM